MFFTASMLASASLPSPCSAQVATAAAVVAGAKSILDKLQDVGTKLTGNAQIAVNGSAQQLSQLISQVEGAAGSSIGQPITSLGNNLRVSVERLANATEQIDAMITRQQACLFLNLDLLTAGLNTVTAGLKRNVPFVAADAPRLVSFIFAGMVTPNVVPRAGGSARVKGFRLWEAPAYAPAVSIQLENGTVLAQPVARHGATVDEVVVPVDQTLVKQRAGECLQLVVTSFTARRRIWIPSGKTTIGTMSLPMCIPKEYDRSVAMSANVAYSVTKQIERTLSTKRFGWGNSSCENPNNVTQSQGWDAEIPAGFRIVRVHQSGGDVKNQTNIAVTFTDKAVTAAGWLDRATCVRTPFSATLEHDTHWFMDLTPVIAGPNTREEVAGIATAPVSMTVPQTMVCAEVPVDAAKMGPSTTWYTLSSFLAGSNVPLPLFVSPRFTAPDTNTLTHDTQVDGYTIQTIFNPTVVRGTCQVCAAVKITGNCAW